MDIIKLVEYNIWANRLIGKQIESLSPELFVKQVGGSFGSIKATVTHLLESEWLWLKRFQGTPIAEVPLWQVDNADIYKEWKVIQDGTLKMARMLAGDKDRKIGFITRKGIRYDMPLEDIIIHVTNHGTYHRGQLTHMIRVVGEQPVGTDYFIFVHRSKFRTRPIPYLPAVREISSLDIRSSKLISKSMHHESAS